MKVKQKAADRLGITHHRQKENKNSIFECIEDVNSSTISAVDIHLPPPIGIDMVDLFDELDYMKDVNGLNPVWLAKLFHGEDTRMSPIAKAIMDVTYNVFEDLKGLDVVIINHGSLIGKQTLYSFLNENSSVSCVHEHTRDLGQYTRKADIIVTATPKKYNITGDMVKPGSLVIDCGTCIEEGKTYGNVHPSVTDVAGYLTSVPGGIGPITIAELMANAYDAAMN